MLLTEVNFTDFLKITVYLFTSVAGFLHTVLFARRQYICILIVQNEPLQWVNLYNLIAVNQTCQLVICSKLVTLENNWCIRYFTHQNSQFTRYKF
jgi:hypothetical protein